MYLIWSSGEKANSKTTSLELIFSNKKLAFSNSAAFFIRSFISKKVDCITFFPSK